MTHTSLPKNPEQGPSSEAGKGRKLSVLRWIRTSFLTGVVIAAPIGITIYVTLAFIGFVDDHVTPLIPLSYNPETYLPFSLPGMGVIVMAVALTLLGAAAANLFGRSLLTYGERIVDRMPVVRNIYNTLKQIFETVVAQSDSTFQQVGLIEYPRRGLYAICFVTTHTKGEISDLSEDELYSVFLPTTPNPTSGFLLFVPHQEITILDMTVEEAAKMVISAGLVEPGAHGVPAMARNKMKVKQKLSKDPV